MEKRAYLCDVIGDGSGDNPYRPAVSDIPGVGWTWQLDSDPTTGRPIKKKVIAHVLTKNHSILIGVPGVSAL